MMKGQALKINPEFPEPRLIAHSVAVLEKGGVIAYPTDTNYGMGCGIFEPLAIDRIYRLKKLSKDHLLSFVCGDLADVARYTVIEHWAYQIMKRYLPGPYTFIVKASPEVPAVFQSKRRTVGIRVPNHPVALALARLYQKPIVSTSTKLDNHILNDPSQIAEKLGHGLDLILDTGILSNDDSSVIDLSGSYPEVIRAGAGSVDWVCV